VPVTAPAVVVSSLRFTVSGTEPLSADDIYQPYVVINISGTVTVAPGKTREFSVETSAAMRGTDI